MTEWPSVRNDISVSHRSIPGGVFENFHWLDSIGRTVALRSTQPLAEINTMDLPEGQRQPMRKPDNFATFMCRFYENPGRVSLVEPSEPVWACKGQFYLYLFRVRTVPFVWTFTLMVLDNFRGHRNNRFSNGSSITHIHLIADHATKMCSALVHLFSVISSITATVWTLITALFDLIYTHIHF